MKELEDCKKENDELRRKIGLLESVAKEDDAVVGTDMVVHRLAEQEEWMKLIPFCIKVIRGGDIPSIPELEAVKQVLRKYRPEEFLPEQRSLEKSASKESLPPIFQSSTRANSVARNHRRKRISSINDEVSTNTPTIADSTEILNIKPLEMELKETRKYLDQMEEELNRTRIRLHQTEAVSEKSSNEVLRLVEENELLRKNRPFSPFGRDEIKSIKVLSDVGVQVQSEEVVDPNESTDFPVFTANIDNNSYLTSPELTVEKLTEELGLATKSKVDILKELSKVNKE